MAYSEQNPMVRVELVVPRDLAALFAAKPQYLYSERMQAVLLDVLTEDQINELIERGVRARPVVFPNVAEVVR